METKEYCNDCSIEIEPDITNPLRLCDDCYKEREEAEE